MPFYNSHKDNIGPINCQAVKMDCMSIFRWALKVALFFALISTSLQPTVAFASTRYWVYFKDKDHGVKAQISQKALARRLSRTGIAGLTQYDISPDPRYVGQLNDLGYKVHRVSRWLNAASVSIGDHDISWLRLQDFV